MKEAERELQVPEGYIKVCVMAPARQAAAGAAGAGAAAQGQA